MLVLPGVVDVHTHTRVASDAEPDRFFQDSREIRFQPPAEWIYRASQTKAPAPKDGEKKDDVAPKPAKP